MGFANVTPMMNPDQADRYALVLHLRDELGWKTAREIGSWTGLSALRIRELCQIYPTLLISGPYGYKLARNADKSEVVHCVQSLIERGTKIMHRAAQLASMT